MSLDLYVVTRNYGNYRIDIVDSQGIYRPVCEMKSPYNWAGAALVVCEALMQFDKGGVIPDPALGDKTES